MEVSRFSPRHVSANVLDDQNLSPAEWFIRWLTAGPHRVRTDDDQIVRERAGFLVAVVQRVSSRSLIEQPAIVRTIPGFAEVILVVQIAGIQIGEKENPPAVRGPTGLVGDEGRRQRAPFLMIVGDRQTELLEVSEIVAALSRHAGSMHSRNHERRAASNQKQTDTQANLFSLTHGDLSSEKTGCPLAARD